MSAASDLTLDRIISTNSEGFRADVYDDATDEPIQCKGQPTVGFGCRVRQWSQGLAKAVLGFQLAELEMPLLTELWYLGGNQARRSALLEIAFNQGDVGLEERYPKLIAACRAKDWPAAAEECTVEEEDLKPRYARIAQILSTGEGA